MKYLILVIWVMAALVTNSYAAEANRSPDVLYRRFCASCHDHGTQGAPKIGDKTAWKPIIAAGMPVMMEVVMKGSKKNPLMLPRAGTKLKEEELKPVVEYMVNLSK